MGVVVESAERCVLAADPRRQWLPSGSILEGLVQQAHRWVRRQRGEPGQVRQARALAACLYCGGGVKAMFTRLPRPQWHWPPRESTRIAEESMRLPFSGESITLYPPQNN
jgi:hypothetical protein